MSRDDAATLVAGDARIRGIADRHINIPEYLSNDSTLSLADRYTYGVLLKYVVIGERTGQGAFPGMETIARECATSVDSVARSVKRLRERGWVVRKRRGLGLTNVYELYGPADDDETHGGGPVDAQKPQPRVAESAPVRLPEAVEAPIPEGAKTPAPEAAQTPVLDAAGTGHKYDERDYDERKRIPPIVPPAGGRASSSCVSPSSAPVGVSTQPAHTIRHTRRCRELEHPYWQDERRRDLATRWLQAYPRKEDPEGGYRAWREVLGEGDADKEVMARFGRACRLRWDDWKQTPLDKIPKPATWLRRREWEHPELVASVPRPRETPPRPHYVSQADLNAATGRVVL